MVIFFFSRKFLLLNNKSHLGYVTLKYGSFSFSTKLSKVKRLEQFGLIKLSFFSSRGRNEIRKFFEQKKDFELVSSLKETISLFRFGKKNLVERDYQC